MTLVAVCADGAEVTLADYKTLAGLKAALVQSAPQAIMFAGTKDGTNVLVNIGHITRVEARP